MSDIFVLECDAKCVWCGSCVICREREGSVSCGFLFEATEGSPESLQCTGAGGTCVVRSSEAFSLLFVSVVTDHRGLVTLMSARQERTGGYTTGLFTLQGLTLKSKYRSGRENGVADCLSCCYDKKEQMCAEDGHSASQKEGGDVGMPT